MEDLINTKKIGIIGLGNCGNQIAWLAEQKYGNLFDCIYINTSDADLAMVGSTGLKFKIGSGELEGSGKNRKRTKRFLQQDMNGFMMNDKFKELVNAKKYVFVVSSTAGGTGSGAAPVFISVMKKAYPDVNFILVAVLPQLYASLGEQENALEFLNELYKHLAESTTYMLYDNESTADLSPTKSLTEVNDAIVEDIRIISGVDNFPTPYDSIDEADMESIVSTPGRLLVTRITKGLTEKTMEDTNIDDIVIKAIKSSKNAETNRDKKVVRWGLITFFTEEVNNLYHPSFESLHEFIGTPIERFNHNAINKGAEDMNFLYFIASGLSPVVDRITKINDRVQALDAALKAAKDTGDVVELAASQTKVIKRNDEKPEVGEVKINDIFDQFR